jgi:hypothetical protein
MTPDEQRDFLHRTNFSGPFVLRNSISVAFSFMKRCDTKFRIFSASQNDTKRKFTFSSVSRSEFLYVCIVKHGKFCEILRFASFLYIAI